MRSTFFSCCLLLFITCVHAQVGKYVTVTDKNHVSCKVFLDYRILQYSGTDVIIHWDGGSSGGYASGTGTLKIDSKVQNQGVLDTSAAHRYFHQVYTGTLVKGKKQGKGTLSIYAFAETMAPWFSYTGYFNHDEFDGPGSFVSNWGYNKDTELDLKITKLPLWRRDYFFYEYKGNFRNGLISNTNYGEGKTYYIKPVGDESVYKGGVSNGQPEGTGEAYNNNPISPVGYSPGNYTGGFSHGKFSGQGKLSKGLTMSEGIFSNNMLNGKGKVTFSDGNVSIIPVKLDCSIKSIEGEFINNQSTGLTVIYFQHCEVFRFEGFTENGELNGTGKIEYLNGDVFRGNLTKGKMEGRGVYMFNNGDVFDGEFVGDKAVSGKLTYKNGSWYEGQMTETESYQSGRKVMTIVRHGSGTMHDADGTTYAVTCVNNNCTRAN